MSNEKLSLTTQDFLHDPMAVSKLSLASFGQIEKAMTPDEFNNQYNNGKTHKVFTPENMAKFIARAAEEINTAESEEAKRNIAKAVGNELETVQRVSLLGDDGTASVRFVKAIVAEEAAAAAEDEEAAETEAEEAAEGSEEAAEAETTEEQPQGEDKIEKGAVADALDYGLNVKFNKTGKEIKERLAVIKVNLEGRAANYRQAMKLKLESCEGEPTREMDRYEYGRMKDVITEHPKLFTWEQCNHRKENEGGTSPDGALYASSPAAANCCSEYNQIARDLVDTLVDKAKIEAYERNLDDKKSYEVAAREATALGF